MKNDLKPNVFSVLLPGYRWGIVLHRLRHLAWALFLPCFAVLSGCGTGAVSLPGAPAAMLSAQALHFASVTIGTSGTSQMLTLSNTGQQPLVLTAAALSDAKDFALTNGCGASVAVGASCTITVQFTPQGAGAIAATLTLSDNSGGNAGAQQVVTLDGTGTIAMMPQAVLSPSTVSFGTVVSQGTPAAQTITVSNMGTAALSLAGYALSDAIDFDVSSTTCTGVLAAGASCTYALVFSPQAIGGLQSTFTLTDNSGGISGAQQTVALNGTGAAPAVPQLNLSATSLSFPATTLMTDSSAQTLTLTNTGSAPLAFTSMQLADPADFSLVSQCGNSLAAGASCVLSIAFTPQRTGAIASTLVVADNSGQTSGTAQQVITLTGTGLAPPVPQATVTPAALSFAATNVGTTTAAQSLTLSNTGQGTLTLSAVSLTDTLDFSVVNHCGASLAPGASCGLSVIFQPQKAGSVASAITITDDSGGITGTQQSVILSGTGTAPAAPMAVITPTAFAFPDTMLTTSSAAESFSLSNTGSQPLVLGNITISDLQNFSLYSGCGSQVAAGASCTFSVVFHPQAVQSYQATVLVIDNSGATDASAAPAAQQTLLLHASGIAFTGPRAAVSPASLSFGPTITNSSSPSQIVTLTNSGTSALTLSGVTLQGTNAATFHIGASSCTVPIAAGGTCSVAVSYSPLLASTSDTASLVFTDDANNSAASQQSATLTGSAVAEVDSVENFGDSITCGFYAQPNDGAGLVYSLEGYAGLLDSFLGVPSQNWCRQGDTAADLARQWVFPNSTPTNGAHQLFTLMIGTNDAYRYGIPQSSLQTYTQEVGAALTWLAMPASDKILANTITQQNGVWTPDVGFGLKTTGNGASLTFMVNQAIAGRSLYVVYHVWDQPYGQAGKATIAVDGVVQATVDESQSSQVYLPTENGTTDTFLVQAVPLGAVGSHTVTFTSAGPDGSTAGLLWAGVPQADYRTVDGAPRVLVGLIPNSPSGNQTFAADVYNIQLKSLVPALTADGMNLTLVSTDRVLDPASDFADLLHPNSEGHAKLAAAFEAAR